MSHNKCIAKHIVNPRFSADWSTTKPLEAFSCTPGEQGVHTKAEVVHLTSGLLGLFAKHVINPILVYKEITLFFKGVLVWSTNCSAMFYVDETHTTHHFQPLTYLIYTHACHLGCNLQTCREISILIHAQRMHTHIQTNTYMQTTQYSHQMLLAFDGHPQLGVVDPDIPLLLGVVGLDIPLVVGLDIPLLLGVVGLDIPLLLGVVGLDIPLVVGLDIPLVLGVVGLDIPLQLGVVGLDIPLVVGLDIPPLLGVVGLDILQLLEVVGLDIPQLQGLLGWISPWCWWISTCCWGLLGWISPW